MRVQRYEADPCCDKKIVIVNVLVNVNVDDEDMDDLITQDGLERLVTKVGEQISRR